MHCRERRLTTSTMNGRGNEPGMERLYFDDIYVSPSPPPSGGRINLVVERFNRSAAFFNLDISIHL